MPPRKSKKSKSQPSTSTPATQTSTQATHASASTPAVVGVDPKVLESYALEERTNNALLGYAKMDILSHEPTFGRWNSRTLNAEEQRALVDSFNRNGLDRFKIEFAIPIVISRDDVDLTTLTSRADIHVQRPDGSHLNDLVFTPSPPKELLFAGGRHRWAALQDWIEGQEDVLRQLQVELVALQKDAEDVKDSEQLISDLQRRIAVHANIVDTNGQWVVALYDKGASRVLLLFLIVLPSLMAAVQTWPSSGTTTPSRSIFRRTFAFTRTKRPPRKAYNRRSSSCARKGKTGATAFSRRAARLAGSRTRSTLYFNRITYGISAGRSCSTTPTTTSTRTSSRSPRCTRTSFLRTAA